MKKSSESEKDEKKAPEAENMTPPQGTSDAGPEKAAGKTDGGVENAAAVQQPTEEKSGEEADPKGKKGPDLAARNAELEKKCAELQDQYLRKAADFDNYRKRMIKEKQDAIDYANTNLLVDLVQILDNFDRAIAAAGVPEAGTPAAAFSDGITMIRNQLGGMLETKYGLAYYPAKGEHFDPTIHEAIGTVPSADVKEPTVSDEFVKGYKLKDRVIRNAKVMVQMPAENAKQ